MITSAFTYLGYYDASTKYNVGDLAINPNDELIILADSYNWVSVPLESNSNTIDDLEDIKFTPLVCPNCGGSVIHDKHKGILKCEYCDSMMPLNRGKELWR